MISFEFHLKKGITDPRNLAVSGVFEPISFSVRIVGQVGRTRYCLCDGHFQKSVLRICPYAVPDKIFELTLFLDFIDRGTRSPPFIRHRRRSGLFKVNNAFGIVGRPCCGARCAPCRQRGCVAHRPLPLAPLPSSATGGGRVALPTSYARRTHNPDRRSRLALRSKKNEAHPFGWTSLFLASCTEKDIGLFTALCLC